MPLEPEDRYAWIARQNPELEPRLTLARQDVAARELEGQLECPKFVRPKEMRIAAPLADLKREPRRSAPLLTQALMGEVFRLADERGGWAFGQLKADGYVGYLRADALSAHLQPPTHAVNVPLSHVYSKPDLKAPNPVPVPFLAKVSVAGGELKNGFAEVKGLGWICARHLKPLEKPSGSPLEVAGAFEGALYLWGGRSVLGLDCSALVQLALQASGLACPRDTDLQAKTVGKRISQKPDPKLCRAGDFVFFPGHAGIMVDHTHILHANATRMRTTIDPLETVVSWLDNKVPEPITDIRRLVKK